MPRPDFIADEYIKHFPDYHGSQLTPLGHAVLHGRLAPIAAICAPHGDCIDQKGKRQENTSSACLFSHYDPHGRVLPYVLFYLRALHRCGCAIHFVSTAPNLTSEDRKMLGAICAGVYLRPNQGRDFGSWQWALRNIPELEKFDWIILANDTVFGPFFDLAPIFERGMASTFDVWGMTDSFEQRWHLQSYFLAIRSTLLADPTFRSIFAQDFTEMDKATLVRKGEIEFSQAMLKAGFKLGASFPYDRLANPSRLVANPYFRFWRELIERQKFPFLKIEHIRDMKARGIQSWHKVLEPTGYNLRMIEEFRRTRGAPVDLSGKA